MTETEKDLGTLFEIKKRELEQQEILRIELLDKAMREWLANPKVSYAEIGRKYGFSRVQVRNYIMRRTGQISSKKDTALASKETDNNLTAIRSHTLQKP